MHSVLENDTDTINEGKLINEALNQGMSSFMPDAIFENIVQNYANAEAIYGEKLIRLLSGYDPSYIRKNIRIPEFCRELKSEIESNLKNLKRKEMIDNDGNITHKGIFLASLILYTEELDNLIPKGITGKKDNKKKTHYGERSDIRNYNSHDRYKDIDLKKTVKKSLKRGHKEILKEDIIVDERKSKGNIEIIYALDASGSMKGKKIEAAKKAGIALAYKAIENRDKVGLIIFGTKIKEELLPTLDFRQILMKITEIKASNETNFTETIERALQMFSKRKSTKHLILLTDGVPTIGKDPVKESLNAISKASSSGITISFIGIDLEKEGKEFAKKLSQISNGKLYAIRNVDEIDKVILEDYYTTKNSRNL